MLITNRMNKPIIRYELIQILIDEYMANLNDNPETIRAALNYYFESFNNDEIEKCLSGFKI